jgi:BirA family biotin operon repressor/biotin-[acetyl-CoA-carboxylase] ligase
VFDLTALESALADTAFAGKLHFSPTTGSTNSDAMRAASQGAPHGAVFFADEQCAGRGRSDHQWLSDAGQGLYVSVLLRLPIPPARLPLLPLAAGLAAAQAIHENTGLQTDLRWPNDLLLGPRKVGGILVEAKSPAAVVVGIGINVHQREFPPHLATPATSTDLESGRSISRQALLVSLLKSLQAEAQALLQEAAVQEIPRRVAAASTWIAGRAVEVHGPQACRGVTEGLDPHGFLRVRTAGGPVVVQTGGIRAVEII